MSDTYDLEKLFVEAIETVTGRPVGQGNVPSATPSGPYAVVTYGGGPRPEGDMGSTTSNRDVRFTVRSVAEDERSVLWMQDKIFFALCLPGAIDGTQWVYRESSSAIVPDGETWYSSTEAYIARI